MPLSMPLKGIPSMGGGSCLLGEDWRILMIKRKIKQGKGQSLCITVTAGDQ